jgi:hypothetical protein
MSREAACAKSIGNFIPEAVENRPVHQILQPCPTRKSMEMCRKSGAAGVDCYACANRKSPIKKALNLLLL